MRIVVAYSYVDDKCIIMGVVKTLGIFFRGSNDKVVDPQHLRYETCQLDVVNHLEVSFVGLLGRLGGRYTSHNHSYISYGQSRKPVFPSGSLLLGWIYSLLADKPL